MIKTGMKTKSETENTLPVSHSRFSPALALTVALTFTLTTAAFASSHYDGPAELPRATVPSAMADTPAPGSIISVNAGDDLQSALTNAQCGDVITLQAVPTFTRRFLAPPQRSNLTHSLIH